MLRGIVPFIQQRTPVKVLFGLHDRLLTPDTPDEYLEPRFSSLVGTLLLGADYRDLHPGKKITPPRIKERIEGTLIDIFSANQNNV